MSDYNGKPGNESILASIDVDTTTGNTVSPIVVTTDGDHGLVTGEYVEIEGVEGNDAANGRFYVRVDDTDQIALFTGWSGGAVSGATTGNGAYTAGGTVFPIAFANAEDLPEDLVDDADAASVNVPFEGNFDREAFLLRRTGDYRITRRYETRFGGSTDSPTASFSAKTAPNGTWGASQSLATSVPLHSLDHVECDFHSACTSRSPGFLDELVYARIVLTVSDWDGSNSATIRGSTCMILGGPTGGTHFGSVACKATYRNDTGVSKKADISIEVLSNDGTTADIDFTGIGVFHAVVRAPNI